MEIDRILMNLTVNCRQHRIEARRQPDVQVDSLRAAFRRIASAHPVMTASRFRRSSVRAITSSRSSPDGRRDSLFV